MGIDVSLGVRFTLEYNPTTSSWIVNNNSGCGTPKLLVKHESSATWVIVIAVGSTIFHSARIISLK